MKKLYYCLFLSLGILFPTIAFANDDYEVKSYEIEVTINNNYYIYNENIELEILKENIKVTKELPKSIEDLEINSEYILSAPYNKLVEIVPANTNSQNYSYNYKNKVNRENKDIKEINIQNTFNNDLNNINFIINLNESFSDYNLEFFINNTKNNNIKYSIKDNTLFGTYDFLKEGDILTIKVNYGKLYFNNISFIAIIVSIILSLLSLLIWYIYGKDLHFPIEKVSKFSRKFNPLDIALIYKGKAEIEDSFYLLLSLANRGYIKIVENDKNKYTIIRDKDYDGKKYTEATFIKSLFKKSESVTLAEYINIVSERKKSKSPKELESEISNENLVRRFKNTSENVLSIINNSDERNKYFEDISDKVKIMLIFFVAIILILVTSMPFIEINNLILLPLSLILSITTLVILTRFVETMDLKKKDSKITILSILSIIVILILLIPSFKRNRLYIIAYLISCISVSFILFLYKYMPKRTLYGAREYTKIEGFKLFIKELSKEELDSIMELNPNYLYDILPYSYMLGLEDIVINKIKDRKLKSPSWFIQKKEYTAKRLNNSVLKLKKILNYQNNGDFYN